MLHRIARQILAFLPLSRSAEPLSSRVFVPSSHSLRAELDDRYLEMRAAMASGDPQAIKALLTPDFVSTDVRGKSISAMEMINSVISLDIDRSRRNAVTTLLDIEEKEGCAYVRQVYVMTYPPDRKSEVPKNLWALSRDVWQKSDNWLLRRSDTLELEVLSQSGSHVQRIRRANLPEG